MNFKKRTRLVSPPGFFVEVMGNGGSYETIFGLAVCVYFVIITRIKIRKKLLTRIIARVIIISEGGNKTERILIEGNNSDAKRRRLGNQKSRRVSRSDGSPN